MFDSIWRKIMADLLKNKLRSTLIIISIVIGVFSVGLIYSLQRSLCTMINDNWKVLQPPNIMITTVDFRQSFADAVKNITGIDKTQGAKYISAQVEAEGKWRKLSITVYPNVLADTHLNVIQTVGGRWPPAERQLFVEQSAMAALGWKMGQQVLVRNTTNDAVPMYFTVIGIVRDCSKQKFAGDGPVNAYISIGGTQSFKNKRMYNTLLVSVTGDANDSKYINAVLQRLKMRVEKSGRAVIDAQTFLRDENPSQKTINGFMAVLGGIGAGALLLSGFLLFNSLMALLIQQEKQIAIMKAVGATCWQIVAMYSKLILFYGLIALVIALPLVVFADLYLISYFGDSLNLESNISGFPWQTLWLPAVIGLFVPFLASVWPLHSRLFSPVRDVLTSQISVNNGSKFEHSVYSWARSLAAKTSLAWLLSIQNAFRRKGRLCITITALGLAGGVFIGVCSVYSSFMLTAEQVLSTFNYDAQLSFPRYLDNEKLRTLGNSVPNIAKIECWGFQGGARLFPEGSETRKDFSLSVTVVGPPADSKMLDITMISGRWLKPGDENAIVINSDVSSRYKELQPGNKLKMKIGTRVSDWTIVGISRSVLNGPMVYVPGEWLAYVTHNANNSSTMQIKLRNKDAVSIDNTISALEQTFKQNGVDGVQGFSVVQIREKIAANVQTMSAFLLTMAFFMGVVGAFGLTGAMSMNVMERTREIGILRAIGADAKTIFLMVIVEGGLVSLIANLIAVVFAVLISWPLDFLIGNAMLGAPLSYSFAWWGILLWLIVGSLLGMAASIVPARQAIKTSVRVALEYE